MRASQLEILPKIEKEKNQKETRLWTAIFLVITFLPSFLFWLIAGFKENKIKLGSFPVKVSVPRIDLSYQASEDISVKLGQWAAKNLSDLPGEWAIEVRFLNSDFSWGLNENDQFTAASLIKLPVVAAFYYQVGLGELDLDDVYVLKEADKSPGAGSLQNKPVGFKSTLAQLASLAFSQSDNTALNILRTLVSDEIINGLIIQWGMVKTDLEENLTTAEDVARFFHLLYQGQIVNEEFKEKMLTDLTGTIFEDQIPAGVPEGIKVAHKVGIEVGVISDAGIIFIPGKPFVLAILSQNTNVSVAKERFPQLVNDLYWLISNP